LRRRTVLAVILALILLAVFVGLLRFALLAGEFDAAVTASTLEEARADRTALRAFLDRMPKGGDLHTHLSGAVYAEHFIAWAAQQELCVGDALVVLAKSACDQPGAVPVASALSNQALYDRLVNAFSMRAFLPTPAVPTGHDQFFATFDRFNLASSGARFADMAANQLREYARQNVQYVEFMVSFSCPNERDAFRAAIRDQQEDARRLSALEASGLADCVAARRSLLKDNIERIRSTLGCDAQPGQPGCNVTFRFIAQILRDVPLDDVFISTAIAAALIRTEPQVVALNYVQPEDALVARRDYRRHMQIIRFLASDVPVALHAGELWIGLVPPEDLTFHIREAIEVARARRIGHGVSVAFEHDMAGLLAEMRTRPVAVEINLTSNDVILGVRGKNHPLPAYLAAGVPVVISSDDAGVSRIDLTNEYFRAVRDYDLGYDTLKAIAGNALRYAFLDDAQKRKEFDRLSRSFAEFEQSVAGARSRWQNVLILMRAAALPAW
jgi:adenosine deaminase